MSTLYHVSRVWNKEIRSVRYLDAEHEASLLAKARQDKGALRELYDHYFPHVYAYIASRVGRTSDAEDLVSATFLTPISLDSLKTQRGSVTAPALSGPCYNGAG